MSLQLNGIFCVALPHLQSLTEACRTFIWKVSRLVFSLNTGCLLTSDGTGNVNGHDYRYTLSEVNGIAGYTVALMDPCLSMELCVQLIVDRSFVTLPYLSIFFYGREIRTKRFKVGGHKWYEYPNLRP